MIPFLRRLSGNTAPSDREHGLQSDQAAHLFPSASIPVEKNNLLKSLFQSGDMITLPNNSSVDLPQTGDRKSVRLFAQSLAGEDSLSESTNSSYSTISEVVAYNWEPQRDVNLLAVHRTKPLVAYVINTTYHKAFVSGKPVPSDPDNQMIRLVNYDNGSRALCKPVSQGLIADIAFAYDSPKRPDANIIATIDRMGVVNLYYFSIMTFSGAQPQLSLSRLMTIQLSSDFRPQPLPAGHAKLAWCLYIPGENDEPSVDPSLRLVSTIGKSLEVLTFNDYHLKQQDLTTDRSFLKPEMGEHYHAQNIHPKDIVSAAVSNDGSLTCSASQANILLFYAIEEEKGLKYLREWSPPDVPESEQIAHFSFLDDADYLLEHPDQTFWGYLFVATTNGHMYIYDLQGKDWALIQEVEIVCEDHRPASGSGSHSFSYHLDKSSKVLVAVRDRSVFVFLLEFNHHESGSRIPRIRQVARHPLYNDVICMQVKQPSSEAIEIFWITVKNLQRCTIDIKALDETKLTQKVANREVADGVATLSKVMGKVPKHLPVKPSMQTTSPKEQELLNKLQEKTQELSNLKQKSETTPTHPVQPLPTPEVRKPRSHGVATPESVKVSGADLISPLLNRLSGAPNGQAYQSPIAAIPNSPAPVLNDMAKIMLLEDKLKTMEIRFNKQFEIMNKAIANGFQSIHSEVAQLKADIQQPSAPKMDRQVVEMTINKVVESSMRQMNVLISNGLKDFFDQADVGINELQTSVKQSQTDLKTALTETKSQVSAMEAQINLFTKQMEKMDAQQQVLMYRYQQWIEQQ